MSDLRSRGWSGYSVASQTTEGNDVTLAVPTFDTQALEEWAGVEIPDDPERLKTLLRQAISDVLAANEHIVLLEYALKQRAA